MNNRVYLDWNATAPLRPEARTAMLAAMDVLGNPSSVHAEGRAARAIIEKARGQVAGLMGCARTEVVFTSGSTESINTVITGAEWDSVLTSEIEHDAVAGAIDRRYPDAFRVKTHNGYIGLDHVVEHPLEVVGQDSPQLLWHFDRDAPQLLQGDRRLVAFQAANSETGVAHDLSRFCIGAGDIVELLCDLTQLAHRQADHGGRQERAADHTAANSYRYAAISSHKMGGPSGVGALIMRERAVQRPELAALMVGGGQETSRRSGTENIIGIAGFGAAAEAALQDLEVGVWDRVEKLRDILENVLAESSQETIFVGKGVSRLPNTSCFITPGWKGETQVMQMDLAGYAISAGSACSSGKVKESRVLRAMGYDSLHASSAVRVSLGPTTTEDEVRGFARAWADHHRRWKDRRG